MVEDLKIGWRERQILDPETGEKKTINEWTCLTSFTISPGELESLLLLNLIRAKYLLDGKKGFNEFIANKSPVGEKVVQRMLRKIEYIFNRCVHHYNIWLQETLEVRYLCGYDKAGKLLYIEDIEQGRDVELEEIQINLKRQEEKIK